MSAALGYLQYLPYLGLLIGIVFVVWVKGGNIKQRIDNRRLRKVGVPASGHILSVRMGAMRVRIGIHRYLQLVLEVEVHFAGRPPYEAQVKVLVSELQIPQIQPGATVQVRVDPANPAKLMVEAVGGAPLHGPSMSLGGKVFFGVVTLAAITVALVNGFGVGISDVPDTSTVCGRAMACCQTVARTPSARENCRNFGKIGVPEEACQMQLDGLRRSARALGLSCEYDP